MHTARRTALSLAVVACSVPLAACSGIGAKPAVTTYVQVVTQTPTAPPTPTPTQTPATMAAPSPAQPTVQQAPAPTVTVVRSPARTVTAAPEPEADPGEACTSYYLAWDRAVRANSSSRAKAAHAKGVAAGCNPDTWLPSKMKTTYDPNTAHSKGDRCSMKEVGTYDSQGNVCTQDVENHPHWN